MRRLLALAALSALSIVPLGCGFASYEQRLEATQGRLQDEMVLDRTLYSASTGPFQENNIYLRIPQGLAPTAEFRLIPLTPGFFEVEASYVPQGAEDQVGSGPYQLHILARRDAEGEEATPAQGQPPADGQAEPPKAPRNDFKSDVFSVLEQVYGPEIRNAPVEQVGKTIWPRIRGTGDAPPPSLSYERVTLTDRNQQLIHVYFYTEKSGNATYDVAQIWEFPTGSPPTAGANPVDLTLGTLAVGQRAQARFSGRPDTADGAEGDLGGSAVAF